MCKSNPYISIIVPLYNVEDYVVNSLKSIIDQTYRDWQIVLVNDGSKDQSFDIACRFLNKFQVNYITIDKQNEGPGAARRDGLLKAEGDWTIFLDSDDTINKNMLMQYTSFIKQHNDIKVVFSDFQHVKMGEEYLEPAYDKGSKVFTQKEIQRHFLLRKPPLLLPGTLFKTSWLRERQSLFTDIRYSEDISFLWKILMFTENVGYFQTPLYNYLIREKSIMSSLTAEKIFSAIPTYQEIQQQYYEKEGCEPLVRKFLFDRWIIGSMKALTHTTSFDDFRKSAKEVCFSNSCRNLLRFPDRKVQMIAGSYLIHPQLFYSIASRI